MKCALWALIAGGAVLASTLAGIEAATIRPIPFDEMVRQAETIVHGRTIEIRSYRRGTGVARNEAQKLAVPPAADPVAPGAPQAPEGLGTRGGRMIFTRVVLQAADSIKGGPHDRVEFDIAGGTVDGRTVWVPGMPEFERGADYVLFLRRGYAAAADPIVGVRQGFFRVVNASPSGSAVLNADFDYVIGIEDSRVVARHNPQRGQFLGRERPAPLFAPPPVTDAGSQTTMSAEARRYLSSTEPPVAVEQFVAAIRARLGR